VIQQTDEITGTITFSHSRCLRIDKLPNTPIFRNSMDFSGERVPAVGEIWRIVYEVSRRPDAAFFARQQEYVGLDEGYQQPLALFPEEKRPAFEDAEWFWLIKDERSTVFNETHQQYIASDAWKRRLEAWGAVNDSGSRCRANLPGCVERATQVHHTSYRYIGCEPTWDLQPVCDPCHSLLTAMDKRGRPKSAA
jgi:hypothetical protein